LDESLPQISGSKVHLGKLIMNIVGNAFEAMNDSGEIQIKTSTVELSRLRSGLGKVTPGIYVTLSIRDTGHGIAVEDRQKIFEPYFSRKQMGKSGSGLGLAVVYGVVKDHSGYYDLLSEVGVGTEFLFYFPLKSDFESREECKARSKTGKCVLVVDDSSMAREQTMQMLRSMGHIVASVPNGHEAVKYLQDRPVDLIVLDMLMEPDFDGLDTYQEILKVRPGQKVIVVSGYLESDRAQAILRAGAIALLRKPLTADALSVAMREAMGIAALP
jgi:CheY-like chemotaxis protein